MKTLLALIPLFCLAACGQGSTLGLACTSRSNCEMPLTCYVGAPGGMCSKGCVEEGSSRDCTDTSVCAFAGGTTLFCAQICDTDAQCRPDYLCKPTKNAGAKGCVPATFQ